MVEVFRNRPSLCMNALKQFSSSIRYEIIMQISSDQPIGIFVEETQHILNYLFT